VFISKPVDGHIYIAERSRKGSRRLLWSAMPVAPIAGNVRIEARDVPHIIRRAAYRLFERDQP
jgi:hypothetical protein